MHCIKKYCCCGQLCHPEIWDKKCFRYVSKGRRLLKNQQLVEELEKSLDDKAEKEKLVEGFLGYIICSTQVILLYIP